ncbi:1-acylglycerol-3-phosphate O-acyltransferase [Malassezia sp. CBS 17886]|nr:1-acylglycerol-3-phosphate O-acyltransferase [Malassezia sp. CBS 17886]
MGKLGKTLLTALSLAFGVLTLASARSRKARYYLNMILFTSGLAVCSLLGVTLSLLMALIPGQRFNVNFVIARTFYKIMSPLTGIRMVVEGQEHMTEQRSAIIVGNHQSQLDVLYLGAMMPKRCVMMSKKELRWAPLLGQFLALGGAVFIDRKSRSRAIATMREAGQYMKRENLALFAFPEGTRSNLPIPDLLPFKKGVFHLAIQSQIPIIPVVCENYFKLYDSRSWFDAGTLHIACLEPISTQGLTEADTDQLIGTVRTAMLKKLRQFDAESDRADVESTLHPSKDPRPYPARGVAGLAMRLIGSGHEHKLQRIAQETERVSQTNPDGKPSDFGLRSAAAQ